MKMFRNKWGKWIDLSVGHLGDQTYLLQAKRHKNGKLKFSVAVSSKCYYQNPKVELSHIETIKPI